MIPAGWVFSCIRDFRQCEKQLQTEFGREKKEWLLPSAQRSTMGQVQTGDKAFGRCFPIGTKEEKKSHQLMPVMLNENTDLLCHPVSFITSAAVSNRHLCDACTSRDLASPGDDSAAPCLSFPSHRQSKGAQGRQRSGVGEFSSALLAQALVSTAPG